MAIDWTKEKNTLGFPEAVEYKGKLYFTSSKYPHTDIKTGETVLEAFHGEGDADRVFVFKDGTVHED